MATGLHIMTSSLKLMILVFSYQKCIFKNVIIT